MVFHVILQQYIAYTPSILITLQSTISSWLSLFIVSSLMTFAKDSKEWNLVLATTEIVIIIIMITTKLTLISN